MTNKTDVKKSNITPPLKYKHLKLFVLSGTTVEYSTSQGTVTGGSYDNTTGTLTVTDNVTPNSFNPVGQVSVPGKSISRTLQGFSDMPFMVTYWEP